MIVSYSTLLPVGIGNPSPFIRPSLAAGYLSAYAGAARDGRDRHDIVSPGDLAGLRDPEAIATRLLREDPRVVALSVYVWNVDQVDRVIRRIRRMNPAVEIVVGGPEVAYTPMKTFEDLDADWVCTGEGEIPFLSLLNRLDRPDADRASLPGLLHRSDAGRVIGGELVERLDDIPSPYLTGHIGIEPGGWVDIETTRGCPFRCRFCLYGKTFSSLRYFSLDRVRSDVAHAIQSGAAHVYLMDPTFNYPPDRCMEICGLLADLNHQNQVSFSTEARAEMVDEPMADAFWRAGIRSVEVGLQSSNREALKIMKRSLNVERFVEGCIRLRERGIRVDIGVIVGLPGDTEDSIRRTVAFIGDRRFGYVYVYRLQLLPGSEYHGMATRLGLQYDPAPPYYVRRTPELNEWQIVGLMTELKAVADEANDRYLTLLNARSPSELLELACASKKAIDELRPG